MTPGMLPMLLMRDMDEEGSHETPCYPVTKEAVIVGPAGAEVV